MTEINSKKRIVSTASVLMAVSVLLGAFGAHFLKKNLHPEELAVFETAVRYQVYHSFGLFFLVCLSFSNIILTKSLSVVFKCFVVGIVLFSGSLYALTFCRVLHVYSTNWLGAITPLGGLLFIFGWIYLAFAISKKIR